MVTHSTYKLFPPPLPNSTFACSCSITIAP